MAERADAFREIGAGIQLTPNALRVLAELGLEQKLTDLASQPKSIEIRSWRGTRIVSLPLGKRFRRRHGHPYLTLHRADLQDVLANAARAQAKVSLMPAHEVAEFALHPKGITVMLSTPDGHTEIPADVLIGADGVNSFVRSTMPDRAERRPTGRSAWRAMLAASDLPKGIRTDRVGLWLGKTGHVVHYPVRDGAEFNIVAVTDGSTTGEAQRPVGPAPAFRGWARPVRDLLEAADHWREWPIATVKPSGAWASGPVALLGDAAHAMAPYLAQGAAMAIEDAATLATELAASEDLTAALARYEAVRRRRVKRVWRAANGAADLYHMGALTGSVRNVVMSLLGGTGLALRYDWIYRWQPPK